ncbi:MAG: hypothetical protein IJZ93_01640 [Clostridia bacterium]|nr:hypothetical protein [Clostridia bacterium]
MKDLFSNIFKKLKNPSGTVVFLDILIFLVSIVATVLFLVSANEGPLSYIFYALSAVSFFYGIYLIVIIFPKIKERIRTFLQSNPLTRKMMTQYDFRTVIFSTVSLFVNVAYAAATFVIGIISRSMFYISFSCYHISLLVLRSGAVLLYKNRDDENFEQKSVQRHLSCGIMLVILPIALFSTIIHSLIYDIKLLYADLMIYAVAAYAFFKITVAIINFVKARRDDDYIVRSLRNINLSDALITLFMLQVALINTFSAEGENITPMNFVTGAAVCFITIAIGIYMIKASFSKIKNMKENQNGEQG